jgi:hypothetical protein
VNAIDALGQWLPDFDLRGAYFTLGAGFGAAYPPPGEVGVLQFGDAISLTWTPEG